ncbi:T9SS type B sorting domain-containing protein, partial [Flavobacterium zepuense]
EIEGVSVIDYPHYFTPNGDGYHDEWNIIGMQNLPQARIYIFDRYGKLLKQISPSSAPSGWDGTFNGNPVPSDDYWFTITYPEGAVTKEFKAHFTLKR